MIIRPPVGVAQTHPAESSTVLDIVPKKRWGRALALVLLAIVGASIVTSMVTNPRFGWEYVGRYLFAPTILQGIVLTIVLTVTAMALGIALGAVIAVWHTSENPILRVGARGYAWFFRAVPPLVQLLFWSFFAALYPVISVGLPFGPTFFEFSGNLPLFVAAFLGLGLMESSYMAEIIRSGLLSVDDGQVEAAKALGLNPRQTMMKVRIPQAMRVIIPPFGSEVISMLKTTSLVSVIAYQDLLYSAQLIYSRNFQQIPLLIVVTIWYLVLAGVLSIVQSRIEMHYGRATSRRQGSGRQL